MIKSEDASSRLRSLERARHCRLLDPEILNQSATEVFIVYSKENTSHSLSMACNSSIAREWQIRFYAVQSLSRDCMNSGSYSADKRTAHQRMVARGTNDILITAKHFSSFFIIFLHFFAPLCPSPSFPTRPSCSGRSLFHSFCSHTGSLHLPP